MEDWYDDDEPAPALGVVPVEGRGRLPFALVHGESLLAAASWSLGAAGVDLFDLSVPWAALVEAQRVLVVHDPLCPLTPADFVAQAVAQSRRTGAVVVGVRPVTDTVKVVLPDETDGAAGDPGDDRSVGLGETLDRDDLLVATSPVVLPAGVLAAVAPGELDDLPALVARLAQRFPVQYLPAPALARRIGSEAELEVLAALSEVARAEQGDVPLEDSLTDDV